MYIVHCHIVLTMIFGVQFPISPSVVLSFFEKFREITHTLKKSIVTTSERQWIHCHSFFRENASYITNKTSLSSLVETMNPLSSLVVTMNFTLGDMSNFTIVVLI